MLDAPPFGLAQADKAARLVPVLDALTRHHRASCPAYRRLTDVLGRGDRPATTLAEVPWLPVGLWKSHRLVSVPDDQITTTLTSSGTTGQVPSRVYLDHDTARRQARALARVLTHVLGPRRVPMIIVDHGGVLRDRAAFSARGAGVLGMMTFGAQPRFVLDADHALDRAGLADFLARHGDAPFLIFGFTYMIWAYFYEQVRDLGLDLRNATLIHSGGWKVLAERAVDNATFRSALTAATGLTRIYNFYGMVEQIGSVFLEGDDGLLYPPTFADVLIRDPLTLAPAPIGTPGVIQTVSALPTSYPGHSVLTEDLGVIERVDDGDRRGHALRMLGRVPRAELRGCSDTHAAAVTP
ncbi:MAG: acyl-protein synthetase [Myxococcales bacterium]|nr:acyl-protein synthetase [Myxococcales bacterium]